MSLLSSYNLITCNISACKTYEQLVTCENMIQVYVIDRYGHCPTATKLAAECQLKRVDLMMTPVVEQFNIRNAFSILNRV